MYCAYPILTCFINELDIYRRQEELEAKLVEEETAKRVEEMVAKRVAEELKKRKDEIEAEVLRRVEEAKRLMEQQMLEEMGRKKKEQEEEEKRKKVWYVKIFILRYSSYSEGKFLWPNRERHSGS